MRLFILAALALSVLGSAVSHADYNRRGYRYKTRYVDFDRGFSRTYGYTEERCYTDYRWNETRTTCYNVNPYDYVYVQEQEFYDSNGNRYTRISTYYDEGGRRPIAYYDCYEGRGYYRQVHHRYYYDDYYHSHRHYHHPHYHTYWVVQLNWENWETKVFLGAYTSLLGLDIMLDSDSDAGRLIGAALFIGGKVKKAMGWDQRASELQKGIETARKEDSADVLEDLK